MSTTQITHVKVVLSNLFPSQNGKNTYADLTGNGGTHNITIQDIPVEAIQRYANIPVDIQGMVRIGQFSTKQGMKTSITFETFNIRLNAEAYQQMMAMNAEENPSNGKRQPAASS